METTSGNPQHADGQHADLGLIQGELTNFITRNEIAVGHIGVTVHIHAIEHWMTHTTGFVLDPEQWFIRVNVNEIEEAVLMLIAFFYDQATLEQFLMRS
jgi:hypothetical protein